MTDDQWSGLRPLWLDDAPGEPDARAQMRRAERARVKSRITRTSVALVAVGGLIGAVGHAANPVEATMALAVGLTIGATWLAWAIADRRRTGLFSEPPGRFLEARRDQLRSELRTLQFVWVALALELAFLVPWWLEGIPKHFGPPSSISRLLAFWAPVGVVAGFLFWTIYYWRGLRAERTALDARSREAD
jgi:hypothetical protein